MELNIVNPTAPTFNEAIGISEKRANELSDALDAMVENYSSSRQLVRTCDIFNEIASFCNNLEEVIYCTINHANWHAARGMLLCPPQNKKKQPRSHSTDTQRILP